MWKITCWGGKFSAIYTWHPRVVRGAQRVILKIVTTIQENSRKWSKRNVLYFFFSHRSRDSMFRNRETRGQEVSGTAILIFGCSFFRPHPSAILSPRIIRHRLHTRAHTPFDTCIFIPPPRFHGEISGLERATPSNCALWKHSPRVRKISC